MVRAAGRVVTTKIAAYGGRNRLAYYPVKRTGRLDSMGSDRLPLLLSLFEGAANKKTGGGRQGL
jgi:hypothetical protein